MRKIFYLFYAFFLLQSESVFANCPDLSGTYVGLDINSVEYEVKIIQTTCEEVTIEDSRHEKPFTYKTNGELQSNPQPNSEFMHVKPYFISNQFIIEVFDHDKNKVYSVIHSINNGGDLESSLIKEDRTTGPTCSISLTSKKTN